MVVDHFTSTSILRERPCVQTFFVISIFILDGFYLRKNDIQSQETIMFLEEMVVFFKKCLSQGQMYWTAPKGCVPWVGLAFPWAKVLPSHCLVVALAMGVLPENSMAVKWLGNTCSSRISLSS
jgi:hypothetical protein